jgi:hypothetical protein
MFCLELALGGKHPHMIRYRFSTVRAGVVTSVKSVSLEMCVVHWHGQNVKDVPLIHLQFP